MTLGDWLQLIGTACGFAGLCVYVGRLLQRLEAEEERGDRLEADMKLVEAANAENKEAVGDVRSDVEEMRGSLKELDSLKTLPEKLTHVSSQLDKIAGFMQGLDKDLHLLNTTSKLQEQALKIIDAKATDHEKRLRDVEAREA